MGYKQYFVYMMSNRWHNVLYTGVTNSLQTRVWQHKHGTVKGFTKKYNCDQLVYHEIYGEVTQAIAREKQIKNWPRKRKDELVATLNPQWHDLAADWYTDSGVIPRREDGAESPDSGDPALKRGMTRESDEEPTE